jgi:hypothetical protein
MADGMVGANTASPTIWFNFRGVGASNEAPAPLLFCPARHAGCRETLCGTAKLVS